MDDDEPFELSSWPQIARDLELENKRLRAALEAILAAKETGFPEALQMGREALKQTVR